MEILESEVFKDPKANEVLREHLAEVENVEIQDHLEVRDHQESQD
jgi:hypothetical protein